MSNRLWNNNEDEILTNIVLEYKNKKNSLSDAFREASRKLFRTKFACESRWNKVLKNKKAKNNKRDIYLREINKTLATIEKEQREKELLNVEYLQEQLEIIIKRAKEKKLRYSKLKENFEQILKYLNYEDKELDLNDLPNNLNKDILIQTIKLLLEILEDEDIFNK